MILDQAFNDFILYKRGSCKKKTVESYINQTFSFLQYVNPTTDIKDITTVLVRNYCAYENERCKSQATAGSYIRSVKTFLRWLSKENYDLGIPLDKILDIKVPSCPIKEPHILTEKETKLLFDCLSCKCAWLQARNTAIICLRLDSGLRQEEVTLLRKSNIDVDNQFIKIIGKGNKIRSVGIGKLSLHFIHQYITLCPFLISDILFLDRCGKPITCNAVRVFVNRLKKNTGLPDLCSHNLRHNFATNFCLHNLEESGNSHFEDLSIILGHSSTEITKRYDHSARGIHLAKSHFSRLDFVYSSA